MNISGQLGAPVHAQQQVMLATSSVAPVSQRANWSAAHQRRDVVADLVEHRVGSVSRPVAITSPRAAVTRVPA
jgi:hypothetical protein